MSRTKAALIVFALIVPPFSGNLRAQDLRTLLNLRGKWKFELGDNMKWADPKFNDSKWDEVRVPRPWEDEGYPGYDGYAWYRKHFTIDKDVKNIPVYLRVGYVDDVCEVYLNGHMVGFEGQFPPDYITAYNVSRAYHVPPRYLNYDGDNVLAVRVYDDQIAGGIVSGSVGLYEERDYLEPDYNLAGTWKFMKGDDLSWKEQDVNDAKWADIVVPAFWETQGYKDYDGLGWYRMKFKTPTNLAGKRLILLAGKIDDFDETYLNGKLLGRTGHIRKKVDRDDRGNEYSYLRAYSIPSDMLVAGGENVLAVRVCDVYLHGGIYDGPIGLITREHYREWKRDKEDRWTPFDWFR
jgi:hypothetical protein